MAKAKAKLFVWNKNKRWAHDIPAGGVPESILNHLTRIGLNWRIGRK